MHACRIFPKFIKNIFNNIREALHSRTGDTDLFILFLPSIHMCCKTWKINKVYPTAQQNGNISSDNI